MGNTQSGANDFALGNMAKGSNFDKDELKKFQTAFMKVAAESPGAGTTVIDQEQFGKALAECDVKAVNGNFLSLLFNAFDKNGDGAVNFVEFTTGLSIVLKGTPAEKYEMCFSIYDKDKSGYLDKDELLKVLTSMNVALKASENNNNAYSDSDIKGFVDTIFSEAGGPEKLSYDQFLAACSKHPELVEF